MGNKLDLSSKNNLGITKMARFSLLSTQSTKTSGEVAELAALRVELDDFIIDAADYNATAQASDVTTTDNKTGILSSLTTTDKSNIVNAANEINQKVTTNSQITSLRHEISLLKMVSSVKNRVDGATGIFFDDNSGLNAASIAILDTAKTNTTTALSVGAVTIPVLSVSGLSIGKEVTIFDDVNLERRVITGISGLNLTVAALSFSYKNQTQVSRSSVIQDTINGLMKFGGWNYQTSYTNNNVVVTSNAYDTSGNCGRRIVLLSNGWLVCAVTNSTTNIIFYKSTDNGATWTQLCFYTTGATYSISVASFGTIVYMLASPQSTFTSLLQIKFDATTVTNINQTPTTIETQTSFGLGCSIITDSSGNLYAVWSSMNATFPNSFNIRYSKSTNGGTSWSTATQITSDNTSSTDSTIPSIIIRSNGNLLIARFYRVGFSTYAIFSHIYNGSSWTSGGTIYNAGTYAQTNPTIAISPNGRIWCAWNGIDSVESAYNIRYSYSDDGGATWLTPVKLTTGNTYQRVSPVIGIDVNNYVYILWNSTDATSGFNNIFRNIWTGTTFQGVTKLTSNTTGSIQDPSMISNTTIDFTLQTPPMICRDDQATSVKYFSGTQTTGSIIPVLVEDVRYNISPSSNISSAVSWMQHESDNNYSITGSLSIHASGGNEVFSSLTKSSVAVDGSHTEDQFSGALSSNAKGTLRYTLTRNSTSLVKNISQITGAVG